MSDNADLPASSVDEQTGLTRRDLFSWAGALSVTAGLAVAGFGREPAAAAAPAGGLANECRIDVPVAGQRWRSTSFVYDIQMPRLPNDVEVDRSARIPMRDGVELAATVYRPAGGGPVPVLAAMTPYGRDDPKNWLKFAPAATALPFDTGTVRIHQDVSFEAPDPGYWVPRGYAVVMIDDPGTGESGANIVSTPGPAARWYDAIDWISTQPWCDGAVAVGGTSFLAIRAYSAGISGHPALKAIMPWEGFNVTGRGAGFGGIPEIAFAPFVISFIPVNPLAPTPEALVEAPLDGLTGGPLVANLDLSKITVPTLLCASFSDQELHSFDTFEAWTRISTPAKDKWLYNHRSHKWASEYGTDPLKVQTAFLDRYLKHAKTRVMPDHVRLEVSQTRDTSRVMSVSDWPVPGTRDTPLYLDACQLTLSTRPPVSDAASRWFTPETQSSSNRVALDYTFTRDTDLVGYMALRLWVETNGSIDSDLYIGVEKLDRSRNIVYFHSSSGGNPNGPVTRGWQRVSCRALDPTFSTPSKPIRDRTALPEPVLPGEPTQLDIALMPSGTTFLKGETLRLVVQSWPGWDDAGEKRTWLTLPVGQTRILTGPQHRSRLLVPVVP